MKLIKNIERIQKKSLSDEMTNKYYCNLISKKIKLENIPVKYINLIELHLMTNQVIEYPLVEI